MLSAVGQQSQGIRPLCLGLTWTLTSLAIVAVALRFYIRMKIGPNSSLRRSSCRWLGWDDWTMLLALVFQLLYQVFFTLMCYWGNGLPVQNLTAEQEVNISKWGFISAIPSMLVSAIARISICILLVRLFGTKILFKRYIIACTSLVSVTTLLALCFLGASSRPWAGLWDTTIPAVRWNLEYYEYTAVALQFLLVISDLTYVLFPVIIIWSLHIRIKHRIAVILLMSGGLITMGAATTKIAFVLIRLSNNVEAVLATEKYFQSLVNLMADCEQCLVIIMGCIPALKLLKKLNIRFPLADGLTLWLASLIPRSLSSRSIDRDRELSVVYKTSGRPSYQDLESDKPMQRI